MNEAQFDEEFNVEDITNATVNQAKAELNLSLGIRKDIGNIRILTNSARVGHRKVL